MNLTRKKEDSSRDSCNFSNISTIINHISEEFTSEVKQIQALISSIVKREALPLPELLTQAANHIINSGGKRLRPLLTLITARICRLNGLKHCLMGAAVELMHTATLLHDDVVDASETRRNIPSANSLWGNKTSILVGDYLLGNAFDFMVQAGSLPALSMLAGTAKQMSEAELLQLQIAHNLELDLQQYIRIVGGKTAALFGAACAVSVYLGLETQQANLQNSAQNIAELFYEFGYNIGIIYQIVDDYLDYHAKSEEMGKEVWQDFAEKKITFPIILLKNKLNTEELSLLSEIFTAKTGGNLKIPQEIAGNSRHNNTADSNAYNQGQEADISNLKTLLHKYPVKRECYEFLQKYIKSTNNILDKILTNYHFLDCELIEILRQLAPALCDKILTAKLD